MSDDNKPPKDEPEGRDLPDMRPVATTLSSEPEKDFRRSFDDACCGNCGDDCGTECDDCSCEGDEPEERDLPEDGPRMTTMSAEPEKDFGGPKL